MSTSVPVLFALGLAVICSGSGAVPVQDESGQGDAVIRRNDRLSRNSNRDWSFHHTWSLPHFPSLPSVTSFFHDDDDEDVKLKKRIEALEKTQTEVWNLLKKLTEAAKVSPCTDKHEASLASATQKPKPSEIEKPQVPTIPELAKKPEKVTSPSSKPASIAADESNTSNKPNSGNETPKPSHANEKNDEKPETVAVPIPKPGSAAGNDQEESSGQANNNGPKQPATANDKGSEKPEKESLGSKPAKVETNNGKGSSEQAHSDNESVKPITADTDSGKVTPTTSKKEDNSGKPATKPDKQQVNHDGPESPQIDAGSSNAHVDADKEAVGEAGSDSANGIFESANSGQGSLNETPVDAGVAIN